MRAVIFSLLKVADIQIDLPINQKRGDTSLFYRILAKFFNIEVSGFYIIRQMRQASTADNVVAASEINMGPASFLYLQDEKYTAET